MVTVSKKQIFKPSSRIPGRLWTFSFFFLKTKIEDKFFSVCKVDELSDLEFYLVDYCIRNHERVSMAFHSSSLYNPMV